jgi:hypothetical protein
VVNNYKHILREFWLGSGRVTFMAGELKSHWDLTFHKPANSPLLRNSDLGAKKAH